MLARKGDTKYPLLYIGVLLLALVTGATIAYAPTYLGHSGPYIVVGAFLVAITVVAILLKWQLGVLVLPALLPYEDLINIGSVASGIKVVALLTLFSLGLALLREQREFERFLRLWREPLTIVSFVFLMWVFASMFWASEEETALIKSITFLGVFALMIITAMLEERDLMLLWAVTALSAVTSIPAAFVLLGGAALATDERFTVTVGSRGLDPNDYACLLAIVFAVAFFGLRRYNMLAYVLAPVIFFGVFASLSRTGLITLLAAPAIVALVPRLAVGVRGRALLMYGLGAIILAGIILAIPSVGQGVSERYLTLSHFEDQTTWSGRWDIWRAALQIIVSHPFLGVGVGNFPHAALDLSAQVIQLNAEQAETGGVAHNMLLSVASELGFIGLLLFSAILFFTFKALIPVSRRSALGTGLFVGVVAYLITGLTLTWEYEKIGYVLIGSVLSLSLQPARQPASSPRRQEQTC